MLKLQIKDETSRLRSVVLGIGDSLGGVPTLEKAYDPKSKQHIRQGTFPKEEDIRSELEAFKSILESYQVKVYRPKVLANTNQVFARDIGFVIDESFVVSNILPNRSEEIHGIDYLLEEMDPAAIVRPDKPARIEGGDIMPWRNHIFAGYSKKKDFDTYIVSRTNEAGVDFLKEAFPHYEVHGFELNKSDDDPWNNALHLDCCFQPVGHDKALIFEGGFKNTGDYEFLIDFFGSENVLLLTREEMYGMYSNIFSIDQDVVVSEKSFDRLNAQLRNWGITVEEVPYFETGKMEGLLRCSTLPLERD